MGFGEFFANLLPQIERVWEIISPFVLWRLILSIIF